MRKIVITPRGFAKCGDSEIKRLTDLGFEVDYNTSGKQYSAEEFLEKISDATAVIVGVDKMDKAVLSQCHNLKIIVKFGVGTDNIDVEYANQMGIKVERTLGTNSRSVAEHVIAMMFCYSKNLYQSFSEVKNHQWNKYTGSEIFDKTLGIVGFGAIGKHLASYAKGLGMKVIAYDVFQIAEEVAKGYEIEVVDLDTLLAQSDYVSLHIPLNDETRDFISLKELQKMKTSSCLLNAARGGVVNEDDLEVALKNKEIEAAYFDVFTQEPPKRDESLLKLDNFFLSPHTASRTIESEKRTCEKSTGIVIEYLKKI